MNRVHLIGELVSPVKVNRDRATHRAWGRAVIAVPRVSGGIDFVPVTLRDAEADMAARYLGDGSLVAISGHLHSALRPASSGRGARAVVWHVRVIADRITYLAVFPPQEGERSTRPEGTR